ncbi:hypothetical protein B0I33_102234 [Prauserella shujinwangii]|uniref:Amidohydrolase-related domain-containing protein n=1 Tax=Prauserella shujinwangii TaxID=1453103 RepID=A0A2T0M0I2_9PSEU|nr:DUF6282 family protein [Prauserella shujinwangii]PRX50116.1 hypothetical protein B0I33_102234 [Prauserella shujinwangii]
MSDHGGFIDIHYHAGPDLYRRRFTVAQAGRAYAEVGGWVVAKSHLGSTAAQAWEARQEGLPVSGSVVLNDIAGGVRPRVIEHAVYQHGPDAAVRLVVYLPTLVRRHRTAGGTKRLFHPKLDVSRWLSQGVLDEEGGLLPEVREVLRAAVDLPVVVATGHCSRDESLRLVDEAVRLGVPRLLLTHPAHPMSGFDNDDLLRMSSEPSVYVEYTFLTLSMGHRDERHFAELASAHPRLVYSSDLGQPDQPDLADWLEASAAMSRRAGLTDAHRRRMTFTNPAELLRL